MISLVGLGCGLGHEAKKINENDRDSVAEVPIELGIVDVDGTTSKFLTYMNINDIWIFMLPPILSQEVHGFFQVIEWNWIEAIGQIDAKAYYFNSIVMHDIEPNSAPPHLEVHTSVEDNSFAFTSIEYC